MELVRFAPANIIKPAELGPVAVLLYNAVVLTICCVQVLVHCQLMSQAVWFRVFTTAIWLFKPQARIMFDNVVSETRPPAPPCRSRLLSRPADAFFSHSLWNELHKRLFGCMRRLAALLFKFVSYCFLQSRIRFCFARINIFLVRRYGMN